jgi:hypothetical protein
MFRASGAHFVKKLRRGQCPFYNSLLKCSLLVLALLARTLAQDTVAPGPAANSGAASRDPRVQLARLTASDGQANDQFGWSTAISVDTVAVGAPFAHNGLGAVYIYVKPSNGWGNMTQIATLTASDGPQGGSFFGYSVAITGNTIVVGALNLPPFDASKQSSPPQSSPAPGVYVFLRPKGGWKNMTENAKLTASDGVPFDYFGYSVAISGNAVVAGAPQIGFSQSVGPGKAYVYVKPAAGWKSATENGGLTASDGVVDDWGGDAVSLYHDTVVFGAENHNSGLGATYVFVKPAGGWKTTTQTAELTTSDKAVSGSGWSVSIFGDTVAVGGPAFPFGQNKVGAVYVFVKPANGWTDMSQTARLTNGHPPFIYDLGFSVYLNGKTLIAGAPAWPYGSGPGNAYVYVKPAGGWKTTSKFNAKLVPADSAVDDRFGFSVGASGSTLVVGASVAGGGSSSHGAAYVFGP